MWYFSVTPASLPLLHPAVRDEPVTDEYSGTQSEGHMGPELMKRTKLNEDRVSPTYGFVLSSVTYNEISNVLHYARCRIRQREWRCSGPGDTIYHGNVMQGSRVITHTSDASFSGTTDRSGNVINAVRWTRRARRHMRLQETK